MNEIPQGVDHAVEPGALIGHEMNVARAHKPAAGVQLTYEDAVSVFRAVSLNRERVVPDRRFFHRP